MPVHSVDVSLTHQRFATGGSDKRVFVWDMADDHPFAVFPGLFWDHWDVLIQRMFRTGHRQTVTSLQMDKNDPWLLVSGCRDGSVRLWDIRKENLVFEKKHDPLPSELSPDPNIQGTYTQEMQQQVSRPKPSKTEVSCIRLKGNRLLSCGGDSAIRVWDLRQRQVTGLLHTAHMGAITSFCFDAFRVISGGKDGLVCLHQFL